MAWWLLFILLFLQQTWFGQRGGLIPIFCSISAPLTTRLIYRGVSGDAGETLVPRMRFSSEIFHVMSMSGRRRT